MSGMNHPELLDFYDLTPGEVAASARSLMQNAVAS
jgi:hypothetical protein